MKREKTLTEKSIRRELILSHLALAIFMVVSLNAVGSIAIVAKFIETLEFNQIFFSFKNGYYTLNDKQIGVPIFINFLIIIALWRLMVWETFRDYPKPTEIIIPQSNYSFLRKFVHLFL
ncbi:MAG: hypothetical protein H7174_13220 [Flavobacterium sp.]|nr:hypothetical protein [Flavobacterium sp.]